MRDSSDEAASTAHGRTAAIAVAHVVRARARPPARCARSAAAAVRQCVGVRALPGQVEHARDLARRRGGAPPRGRAPCPPRPCAPGRGRRPARPPRRPRRRPRASRPGTAQDAGRGARALRHEDEAGEVGAGLDGGGDVLLARQPAHLDERAREQLGELRARVGRAHQRRADEDGVRAGELGRGALGARLRSRSRRSRCGRAGCRATSSSWACAVDRERREVAGVDAEHPCAERDPALELGCVVRLDERVEAEALGDAAAAAPSRRRRGRGGGGARRRRPPPSRSRRCSSVEKKPLASSGAVVAARAARRSSHVPPKRSSTSTEIAAAPARGVGGRDHGRVGVGPQVAGRRRAALDLGDRAEAGLPRARRRSAHQAASSA